MKFKRTVLAFAILATLAIARAGMAQGPAGSPPMVARQSPEQELKRLDKRLKFSDEQKPKIFAIITGRSSAIKTLMEDQDMPMADKFPRMMELMDASNAHIRELLTEAQRPTFDKMLADDMKRREQDAGDGPMGPPPDGVGPPPQNP